MDEYIYSDVAVMPIASSGFHYLAEEFDTITNIDVNVSGFVIVYQISGPITSSDGNETVNRKKIVTVSDSVISYYYITLD